MRLTAESAVLRCGQGLDLRIEELHVEEQTLRLQRMMFKPTSFNSTTMPLNIPGLLVPFQLLLYPRLVIPSLLVKDIRQIDFPSLKKAGYRGAVFDKDNCLTLPHRDILVPELQNAWKSCRETFGEGNVLIVSNSAGTYLDAGGIQSESVTYHLGVPVLFHKSFKPAYSCITAIRTYFSSLPNPIHDHELIVVGDRVFTDVVLANRIRMQSGKRRGLASSVDEQERSSTSDMEPQPLMGPSGPLAIWTTGVWEKESMLMRCLERSLVKYVERWSTPSSRELLDVNGFLKEDLTPAEPPRKAGVLELLTSRVRRA
ncbi:unnamed protein product [Cyclocybe aegerita]|uniref:Uncharacterized protein n=1 Tax=Cyclocybe aegerita TaxID=1973307 RepID=A0A8S0XML8_CYCAE|nr:unnamed protein product [Cyclocybe aegerita]